MSIECERFAFASSGENGELSLDAANHAIEWGMDALRQIVINKKLRAFVIAYVDDNGESVIWSAGNVPATAVLLENILSDFEDTCKRFMAQRGGI
ncbi:MAG: hypothetical protein KGL39_60575 [Patescibacteria group bacterium]|nr:hypothetical protein [Patescibacteria group bacterium]